VFLGHALRSFFAVHLTTLSLHNYTYMRFHEALPLKNGPSEKALIIIVCTYYEFLFRITIIKCTITVTPMRPTMSDPISEAELYCPRKNILSDCCALYVKLGLVTVVMPLRIYLLLPQ